MGITNLFKSGFVLDTASNLKRPARATGIPRNEAQALVFFQVENLEVHVPSETNLHLFLIAVDKEHYQPTTSSRALND